MVDYFYYFSLAFFLVAPGFIRPLLILDLQRIAELGLVKQASIVIWVALALSPFIVVHLGHLTQLH